MKITRVEVVTTLVPIVFGRHGSRIPVPGHGLTLLEDVVRKHRVD